MEALALIIGAVAIVVFIVRAIWKSRQPSNPAGAPESSVVFKIGQDHVVRRARRNSDDRPGNSVLEKHSRWIEDRWTRALAAKESGAEAVEFPAWYFDDATDRQMDRLARMGIGLKRGNLFKGQASDLIGLEEAASDEQFAMLKFFGMPTRDTNETLAKAAITRLMADEQNRTRWEKRMASKEQRDCITFFGADVPKGITHIAAQALIDELSEANPGREGEWSNLADILDAFSDCDFREMVEITKPSRDVIQEAMDELLAEGRTLRALDAEAVAERIIGKHPNLHRVYDD